MNIKRKNVLNCDKNVKWMDTMVLNPAIIEKDGIIHMLVRVFLQDLTKNAVKSRVSDSR